MWATAKPAKAFIKIVKFTIIFVSIEQQDQSVKIGKKKKKHTLSQIQNKGKIGDINIEAPTQISKIQVKLKFYSRMKNLSV